MIYVQLTAVGHTADRASSMRIYSNGTYGECAFRAESILSFNGNSTNNQYMMFVLGNLLFVICAVIYLANTVLVAWKERSPEHRYRNQNLFFYGQITTKLSTTNKTMTLICATLAAAIFMLMAAPGFNRMGVRFSGDTLEVRRTDFDRIYERL